MPTYRITAPDGGTYDVTAPDGASESDVMAYAQANYNGATQAKDVTTVGERITTGLADPIHGAAQLLTKALPDSVVSAGNNLNNWIADKTGLVARLPEGGVDQAVRQREQAYQARRGSEAGSFDAARLGGNVLSPANLAIGYGLPQAASMAGRVAVGALGGTASAAMNPVTEGNDFASEKLTQLGAGAMAGAAVPAVTGALARLISPNASVNPKVQMLKNEGVTPTVGQALGGFANRAEEKMMSVPVVGDAIASARNTAREQFNTAAINRALAPVGQKATGTGQEAVQQAGDAISSVYQRAKSMLGAFQIDQQAAQELATVRQLAQTGLQGRERAAVEKYFREYLNRPALTAEAFKELDSKLGKDAAAFARSNDAFQQKVGDALSEVRRIVTDNAKRANPQASALFKQADEAWANLVRIEGASKKALNTEGVFTPAQLNAAIREADSSVRKRAVARGTALMQDLGDAGQQVLGNKVPNSGTADRLMLGAGSLATGMLHPAIPAALIGSSLAYTRPVQGLLSGMVTSRPQFAQPVADSLRQSSSLLAPFGAQIGLGLLQQ